MDDRRIFLALDLSDAARAACNAHIEKLRNRFPNVRIGWETPEKLHITVKFLGNTGSGGLAKLQAGVAELAAKHESFSLRLLRTGVFPRASRPRVLWIGTEDRTGTVQPLYAELEDVCGRLGYPKDARAFRPHVTIGRVRDPYESAELSAAHLETKIEPVQFEVAELVIYESKLQPTGSVYSRVASFRLSQNRERQQPGQDAA